MGGRLDSASEIVAALQRATDPAETEKIRNRVVADEPIISVRMGMLFEISKRATDLAPAELEQLFDHPAYEPRLAAFCILDFRARRRLSDSERAALADTYLDRHDAITTWDMVDRAAPRVLGWPILIEAIDFSLLHDLAASADALRRRSAITAPLWFIRKGSRADVERGLVIADQLSAETHPRVTSAVKIYRKHASKRLA